MMGGARLRVPSPLAVSPSKKDKSFLNPKRRVAVGDRTDQGGKVRDRAEVWSGGRFLPCADRRLPQEKSRQHAAASVCGRQRGTGCRVLNIFCRPSTTRRTTLRVEIGADKENVHDFNLKPLR